MRREWRPHPVLYSTSCLSPVSAAPHSPVDVAASRLCHVRALAYVCLSCQLCHCYDFAKHFNLHFIYVIFFSFSFLAVCSGRCCSVVACNTIQEEEEIPQAVQCAKCRHFHGDQLVGSGSSKEADKGSSPSLNLPGQVPESDSPHPEPSQCRPSTPPSPHEGSPLLASRPVSPDLTLTRQDSQAISDVQIETVDADEFVTIVPKDGGGTGADAGAESAPEDLTSTKAGGSTGSTAKEEVFVVIESSTTECGGSINETSFISKDIQHQISKANQLHTLPRTAKESARRREVAPRSPGKARPKTPGGAQRVRTPTSEAESDPQSPRCSHSPKAPESPSASTRLLSDTDRGEDQTQCDKEKPPFKKSLSVDSAKMSAVKARLEGADSPSESITALNLSPVKMRKKISVPFRMTPDGTKVNFLCDVSMYLCLPFLSVMSSLVSVVAGLTLAPGIVIRSPNSDLIYHPCGLFLVLFREYTNDIIWGTTSFGVVSFVLLS